MAGQMENMDQMSKASHADSASVANKEQVHQAKKDENAGKVHDAKGSDDGNRNRRTGGTAGGVHAAQSAAGGIRTAAGVAKIAEAAQQAASVLASLSAAAQAVVAGLVIAAGTVAAVVASAFFGMTGTQIARRESIKKDCIVYVDKAAIGDSGISVDPDVAKKRNQDHIYSVLFYYGLRPEQCFAVLGNWNVESGLDPTAVETVVGEDFKIGKWKQAAVANDFNPIFHGNAIYESYFKSKNIQRVGTGLGQWTNERQEKLLEYAALAGQDALPTEPSGAVGWDGLPKTVNYENGSVFEWYDLDLQLAYMLDTSDVGDSGAGYIKAFANIGRVQSDRQHRDEEDSLEFRGDLPVETKYGSVDAIGDGEEDVYYDGMVPGRDMSCRDDAKYQAEDVCAGFERDGKYDMYDSHGNYEGQDEEAYKEDFAKIYRYCLYENMVKHYTYIFMKEWEGIDNGTYENRLKYALDLFHQWYGCESRSDVLDIPGDPNEAAGNTSAFKVEEGYGFSVLSILQKTKDQNRAAWRIYKTPENMKNCRRIVSLEDDKSLARTAVNLAWPTRTASEDNNGTKAYQYIHDLVMPGDDIYQSCDRTVCTIVRWSGYDDEFPRGATLNVMAYLVGSPRWAELEWNGDPDNLWPGDILIRKDSMAEGSDGEVEGDTHHVAMYVSKEIVSAYWKENKTSDEIAKGPPLDAEHYVVHGSYGERSPGIDAWNDNFSNYHAFRCIHRQPKGSSKYSVYNYNVSQ